MKTIIYAIPILFLTLCTTISVKAQVIIDFESGFVSSGYIDVRIPGDQGTFFSLTDDLQDKTKCFTA